MPWLEEEDQLLKEALGSFIVTDARAPAGRPVRAWYRWPEPEMRGQADVKSKRELAYPFITVDLIDISEALDRAHRGGSVRPTVNGYRPPEFTGPPAKRIAVTDWPVAMDLVYQVQTWTRSIQHDRQLVGQMWARFPGRYGSLGGNASPYVRPFSCQLLEFTPADGYDEHSKRRFRKIFTLKVFSELWATPIKTVRQLEKIGINLAVDVGLDGWFSEITCYE